MYRVAVLGDKESIYGFAALGLDVFFVELAEDAEPIFKKLTQSDYAVIYITEHLAATLSDEIAKFHISLLLQLFRYPVYRVIQAGVWLTLKSQSKKLLAATLFLTINIIHERMIFYEQRCYKKGSRPPCYC